MGQRWGEQEQLILWGVRGDGCLTSGQSHLPPPLLPFPFRTPPNAQASPKTFLRTVLPHNTCLGGESPWSPVIAPMTQTIFYRWHLHPRPAEVRVSVLPRDDASTSWAWHPIERLDPRGFLLGAMMWASWELPPSAPPRSMLPHLPWSYYNETP